MSGGFGLPISWPKPHHGESPFQQRHRRSNNSSMGHPTHVASIVTGNAFGGAPSRQWTDHDRWPTLAVHRLTGIGAMKATIVGVAWALGILFAFGSVLAAYLERDGFGAAQDEGPDSGYLALLALGFATSILVPAAITTFMVNRNRHVIVEVSTIITTAGWMFHRLVPSPLNVSKG